MDINVGGSVLVFFGKESGTFRKKSPHRVKTRGCSDSFDSFFPLSGGVVFLLCNFPWFCQIRLATPGGIA